MVGTRGRLRPRDRGPGLARRRVHGAAILEAILQAHAQFAADLDHGEDATRGLAGELLTASADADSEAATLVRNRYFAEPEPSVRYLLLNGLARVREKIADWREFLDAALAKERDTNCRLALRCAQIRETAAAAEPAAVDELVAIFLQTSASDFVPHRQKFLDAMQLLGRDRELAALRLAFDGATHRGPARLLAERLLRFVFDDRRSGWGQLAFSYVADPNPKSAPVFPRRPIRQSQQTNRNPNRKIAYWGPEGAVPEIPAKLTGEQRSLLTAFAEKPVLWEFRTNLWELFGLPASAEELRQFVAARS